MIILEETDSTNSYLKRLSESGLVRHRTLVCALTQTAGRGQRGNVWSSPPGMGLYLSSFYEFESVTADKQGLWAKAWALAAKRYVRSKITDYPVDVQVKWPNDIILNRRKVGGILVENSVRGSYLSDCVVGVGINLNQEDFEVGFGATPTSIKMMTATHYDVRTEALELATYLEWSLDAILRNAEQEINAEYLEVLYGLNSEVQFEHSGEKISAILRGVDDYGQAILESGEGLFRVSHPDYRISLTHLPTD